MTVLSNCYLFSLARRISSSPCRFLVITSHISSTMSFARSSAPKRKHDPNLLRKKYQATVEDDIPAEQDQFADTVSNHTTSKPTKDDPSQSQALVRARPSDDEHRRIEIGFPQRTKSNFRGRRSWLSWFCRFGTADARSTTGPPGT